MRIAEFLVDRQVSFEALPHQPAFSAQKRAKYLHVKGRLVAKAVFLHGPAGPLVAVLPATRHVDLDRLEAHLGGPVRLASEAEAAGQFRDCEWGVVPPFGNLYGLPTYLEESIGPEVVLVLETHTHVDAVRLRCADFERLTGSQRLCFARKNAGAGR